MQFSPENVDSNADILSSPLRNNFNKLQTLLNAGLGDDQFADGILSRAKLVGLDRCTVYSVSNTSTTSGSPADLGFDGESFDSNGLHDPVTNNNRVTIATTGIYLIHVQARWVAHNTGQRTLTLYKNAATEIAHSSMAAPGGGFEAAQSCTALVSLSAGDYVKAVGTQNSGTTTAYMGGLGNTFMSVIQIA